MKRLAGYKWAGRRHSAAIALVACLLLALLVLRTTGLAAAMESDVARGAALAPGDTRVDLASALMLFHQEQTKPSSLTLGLAMRASRQAPLAVEPVLIAGAAAAAAGDERRAEALLLEARLRDPRSALVRAHLLHLYARRGRVAEASHELAALASLIPTASGALFMPQLAFYAGDAAHRDAFSKALAAHPQLRKDLLLHLVAIGEDPSLVIDVAARSKRAGQALGQDDWQMPLVERLMNGGELERAYRLWLRFTGGGEGRPQAFVHDGSFTGPSPPGPFGWRLSEGGGGVAEFGSRPGLYVDYYGRDEAELARQVLLLAPGRYRLDVEASSDLSEGESALRWRLECLESRTEISNLPLGLVTSARRRRTAWFAVPEGCRGQMLSLQASPAEFTQPEKLWVHQVQVRPAG